MFDKIRNMKKQNLIAIGVLIASILLIIGLAVGIPLSQDRDNDKKSKNILDTYVLVDG